MASATSSERILRAALLSLPALLLPGCYDGDPAPLRDAVVIGREHVTGLAVSGDGTIIEVGATLSLVATGTTPTGTVVLTRDVSWRSSDPAVVEVDDRGRVRGLANGSALVSAQIGPFTAGATITASDAQLVAITVSGDATVDECGTGSYTAAGDYDDGSSRDITALVNWSVSDAALARMSTLAVDRNRLISRLAGSTGVVASRNGVDSLPFAVTISDNLAAIDVTPNAPSQLRTGDTLVFTATGNWGGAAADISRATSWTVVNDDTAEPDIATVASGDANPGRLTAGHGGSGTLTGSCGGLSDSVPVTVVYLDALSITNTQPVTLAPNATLLLGLQGAYSDGSTRSLNESATWTVTPRTGVAVTVSNAAGTRGRITAGSGIGTSTVTASVGGKSVDIDITVE